ncbi:MAG: type II toxin-antitoxin system VapB family antitoxin [Christensenellaceae bacterium]
METGIKIKQEYYAYAIIDIPSGASEQDVIRQIKSYCSQNDGDATVINQGGDISRVDSEQKIGIDTKYISWLYYIYKEVVYMETAKVFENGRSQAVRLPKKFRFKEDEVVVQQLGDAILLVPKDSIWQTSMDGLDGFTSDIFENGRNQGEQPERDSL